MSLTEMLHQIVQQLVGEVHFTASLVKHLIKQRCKNIKKIIIGISPPKK